MKVHTSNRKVDKQAEPSRVLFLSVRALAIVELKNVRLSIPGYYMVCKKRQSVNIEISFPTQIETDVRRQMLKKKGFKFDLAYTSVLKRAIKTLFYIQDGIDMHWIPVIREWRLNERMYGTLQGLNKSETAAKHGEEQVKVSCSYGRCCQLNNNNNNNNQVSEAALW